jgi:quinol monooxygenase YgiN
MYASYIEMQLKPGKMAEAMEMMKQLEAELGRIDGLKQFIIVDRGNDRSTVLALYESAEEQEAATPKSAEVVSRFMDVIAAPPERQQVEVPINFIF